MGKRKERDQVKQTKDKGHLMSRIQQLGTQLKEKSCVLYRKYMDMTGKSLRLEILNLVAVAGIVAFLVATLITGITRNIAEYSWIEYNTSRDYVETRLSEAVSQLNRLDYMDIAYDIYPEQIREFIQVPIQSEATQENSVDNNTSNTNEETDVKVVTDAVNTEEIQSANEISQVNEGVLEEFEAYLYNNIYGEYGGERYYSAYNEGKDATQKQVAEETKVLYTELLALLAEDKWSDESVRQKVKMYYENNANKIIAKESIVKEKVKKLEHIGYTDESKTYLLDSAGNVLFNEGLIKTIDIVEAIKQTNQGSNSTIKSMYPVILNGEVHYLYNESVLAGRHQYGYSNINKFIGGLVGLCVFLVLILKLTAAKIRYIEYLSTCLGEIAKGNLDYKVEIKGQDELGRLAHDMENMECQLKRQIEERLQSEQTKNELITNVAHDLRTPLTSIIGYLGLIKEGKFETEEENARYVDIAYSKAERLKVLIGDLFDYTKLNTRKAELKKEHISAALLMNQMIEELRPQAEEKNIRIVSYVKAEESNIYVDVMKMARVFENLVENAIKYSKPDDVVQVILQSKKNALYISVRNRCEELPKGDIEKLFDRFYRTDLSRNSETGGSGLGLAIAKSIVMMHDGKIWAQVDGNMISFNVKLMMG